jgi:hypothetical protein
VGSRTSKGPEDEGKNMKATTFTEKKVILNIAGGKVDPIRLPDKYFLVNLDKMYYSNTTPQQLESLYDDWNKEGRKRIRTFYIKEDCFEFLSKCIIPFERISIYRFLEHVKRTDVLYFIYLLSTCIVPRGFVEVIVPDYKILAERILSEIPGSENFDKEDIITTTEVVNEPYDPHASIWTFERAKYFFEYEKRFRIVGAVSPYSFDGRDIYLKFVAQRLETKTE